MVMRESAKNDPDLKESCFYSGWKLVESLARELKHLQSMSPDPEVLKRISDIQNLQDVTTQKLKSLIED